MLRYEEFNESTGKPKHDLRFQGPKTFETWRIDSYSRLLGYMSHGAEPWGGSNENKNESGSRDNVSSNLPGLHGFPAGPSHGDFLHKLLQKVGESGFDRVAQDSKLRQSIVKESLSVHNYPEAWEEKLDNWLKHFITTDLLDAPNRLNLSDLRVQDCRMEMEFWFEIKHANLKAIDRVVTEHILKDKEGRPMSRPPLQEEHLNGMLKGFIDLIFRFNNQFYVADYKSNQIGKTDATFTEVAQDMEVLKHRYDLQYSLYTLALHRYLRSRLGEAYDYDRSVGGVAYFFLRGINNERTKGVHFVKPPREMIEALDAIFSGQVNEVHHAA
jgi:exodeoxyribonuclease V beta subunit